MPDTSRLTLLRLDQHQRWHKGDRLAVEAYLAREPALASDTEAVLELIYNEIVVREELGDSPRLEEYLERFPQYDLQLRIQFDVHALLEGDALTFGCSVREIEDDTARISIAGPVLANGTAWPDYDIVAEIGRGGMGVVYRARHKALKRMVALKVMLAGVHAGERERAAFRTEAEAVARLHHPNIVQIYDVIEHDGLPCLALEFVNGPSLEKAAAGQPLPPREAARLVETLARAIYHAHEHGIVHRDLKPSNVLLRDEGQGARGEQREDMDSPLTPRLSTLVPKITDFGVAKLLDVSSGQTPTGDLIGTPHYMAPEQAAGSTGIGPAADIWSLGAILYQLLSARPPFPGKSVLEILQQVRSGEPAPPSRACKGVPRDLETICLRCLEKEPARRYATAEFLAEDLRRFQVGEPIRARPCGGWERSWKWARRRPAAAGLATLSSIVALGLVLFGLWRPFERAQARYQEFIQRRDDILFHAPPFAEAAAGRSSADTKTAIEQALAMVHVSLDAVEPTPADSYLSARANADIRASCYRLILILADAASEQREPAKAMQFLDKAARILPSTPAYHMRRGRYLAMLSDRAGAERENAKAARLQPATAIDFFLRGEEHFRGGDLKRAISDFHNALEEQADDFWSRFFLGYSYVLNNQPNEAQDCIAKCLEQRPTFLWTRLLRARAHELSSVWSEADREYQQLLGRQLNEDLLYHVHLNRGQMRSRRKQLDAAEADLKKAVALNGQPFQAHMELALIYQRQKKLEWSQRELDIAIQRRPSAAYLAECHLQKGRNYYLVRQFNKVVQSCEQALKVLPGHVESHFLRGAALLELRRYPEAAAALEKYAENGGPATTDLYRARGQARLHLNDYGNAIADFTRVLEKEPDANSYRCRGWSFYFNDLFKPALSDFEEAIRRDGGNADAYIGRGLCRAALGNYREAVADAGTALGRAPGEPEMMHNIACIYSLAVAKITADPGRPGPYKERAIEALRRALDMLPVADRPQYWRHKIFPDKALDAIRQSAEFRELDRSFSPAPN